MSPEERLIELGLELPPVSVPAAKYTNVVQVGTLLFVSGKGPSERDGKLPKGKLGAEYTTAEFLCWTHILTAHCTALKALLVKHR
jgi:enamine deaminase RidA (YjgF/YER057c/UK114 family)